MLDRTVIRSKVDELDGRLVELAHVAPSTFEAFQSDLKGRLASERILQVCIEILIDIAESFVSGLRLGLPSDERAVPQRLRDAGVLNEADAALLKEMQRFRNVLVHRYGVLDNARVFANLRRASGDFRRLGRAFVDASDRFGAR